MLKIPPTFEGPDLMNLKPQAARHRRQAAVIRLLQGNPQGSYVLTGQNGSGKTHLGWALYRHAVESGRPASGLLLGDLLAQFREWELMTPEDRHRTGAWRPDCLPADFQTAAPRFLMLDEFEKPLVSEFNTRMLFTLLNHVRDFQHQIVVTSNKRWAEVWQTWARIDPVYGNSIMERLKGYQLIEMF